MTTAEPTAIRDNGPYVTAAQARAQFEAETFGIPAETVADIRAMAEMSVRNALLMTGVEISECEAGYLASIVRATDVESAQIIAGFIVRAFLAGQAASI
jgi:hypothetical protein